MLDTLIAERRNELAGVKLQLDVARQNNDEAMMTHCLSRRGELSEEVLRLEMERSRLRLNAPSAEGKTRTPASYDCHQ